MNTVEEQITADAAEILIEEFNYAPRTEEELRALAGDDVTSEISRSGQSGFTKVDANSINAHSTKPSNVVEFDLENIFLALGESGAILSGDPAAIGSAIFVMCGLTAGKLKKELTVEAGFVYGVAHEIWGKNATIKQSHLIPTIEERRTDYRNPPVLTTQEIHTVLDELDKVGCISREENPDGETLVTLNESCELNWS